MPKPDLTVRNASPKDQKVWDSIVNHPLQSFAWGEFRKSMGIDTERLIIEQHGKMVAGWQLTFHPIPHTPWTIGYFPKGPMPDAFMMKSLQELGKRKHALSIQIEPLVSAEKTDELEKLPLLPSPHPLFTKYTFILDLTSSEEEMMKTMHSKTRYNIRVAQKHGVSVQEDSSDTAFSEYLRLNEETTGRQGFYAHNRRYHETMWKVLKTAKLAHLFTATYEKETLAAWIIFTWGKTIYYPYGTSSRNHREVMAPTLLLWEIVRWAKKEGFTAFDLWGALPPDASPDDPWYGFHRFKQGFMPALVSYVGSYDIVINPLLYQLFNLVNKLRWTFLRIRSGK